MKKITLLLLSLPVTAFSQVATNSTSATNMHKGYSVKPVALTKWEPQSGLVYKEVQGANLGATSFEMMQNNKTAFLSDASNEIVIVDDWTGNVLSRFPVSFAPRDFVYDGGKFYVLNENTVTIYNAKGDVVSTIPFPASFVGVMRLARYNNATYLLLPSGNCVKIEANGASVDPVGYKGWITSVGDFVGARLAEDNNYELKIVLANGNSYQKTFAADKKVGGVYIVGATADRIYLDVQTYVSESPVKVERNIVTIELNKGGLGDILANVKLPDCYYVLSDKDIEVVASGRLLNMVTTPQGVQVFSLTETSADKAQGYPASLLAVKYHFNDHLVKENQN